MPLYTSGPDTYPAPAKITCLMVTADPRRNKIAKTTVNNFLFQTYTNCELVIINSSGKRVTNREHHAVREWLVSAETYPTVGSLRNLGVHHANGDYIALWNDDDHRHPHCLTIQLAHTLPKHCSVLRYVIKADVKNSVLCVRENAAGHADTILFPRAYAGDFQSVTGGDDQEFLDRCFPHDRVVLHNHNEWFPGPALFIGFWHGLNTKTREQFLGEYAQAQFSQVPNVGFTQDMLDYVALVLRDYNMRLDVRKAGQPTGPG